MGAHVADKRGDPGDGGEQQMLGASAFDVDGEAALGDLAAKHSIAQLQLVEMGRERTLWYEFDKKFQPLFVGRRHDGICSLDTLILVVDAQRCVLSGLELEWSPPDRRGSTTNPPIDLFAR
jgi:hypothetical protein